MKLLAAMMLLFLAGNAGLGLFEGLAVAHQEFLDEGVADAGVALHHAVLDGGVALHHAVFDGLVAADHARRPSSGRRQSDTSHQLPSKTLFSSYVPGVFRVDALVSAKTLFMWIIIRCLFAK